MISAGEFRKGVTIEVDGQVFVGMDLVQIRLIFGLILCSAGSKTLILLVAVAVRFGGTDADSMEGAESFFAQEGIVKLHTGDNGDRYFGCKILIVVNSVVGKRHNVGSRKRRHTRNIIGSHVVIRARRKAVICLISLPKNDFETSFVSDSTV